VSQQNGHQPDLQIREDADSDQSTHTRFIRVLNELREEAIAVRMDIAGAQAAGQVSELEARQNYRGAVAQYLREAFSVLARDDVDLERDYLDGVQLGTVTFHPPDSLLQWCDNNRTKMLPGETVPQPQTAAVEGLRDVTDAPSPLTRTFTVNYRQGGDIEAKQETVHTELSLRTLDTAMELATTALGEVGVGIELDEGEQQTKIDDDLKDEVIEWREAHGLMGEKFEEFKQWQQQEILD